MNWYKTLTFDQRINIKDMCIDICGISYTNMIRVFGLRKTLDLIHEKLKMEGFDV